MLSFLMKQIVITLKKGKHFTLPHIFLSTDPNPLLPLKKRDCVTKNFETQVIPRKNICNAVLKKETHAAPSVTIKERHVNNQNP